MKKNKKKKWALPIVRAMLALWSVSAILAPVGTTMDNSMHANAETVSVSGESIAEQILSVEDATLQNYTIEDLIATQSFLLTRPYEGSGRVIDVNEDERVDVFDLCLMKRYYKETGNYNILLHKFLSTTGADNISVSTTGETSTNRVIVRASYEYDFSEYKPVAILADTEYKYLIQFDSEKAATHCVNDLQDKQGIVYAELDMIESLPLDPVSDSDFSENSTLKAANSWGVSTIEADKYAEYLSKNFSNSITVAVIDTGVKNNDFLSGRILNGGWDFVNGDSDPTDDEGHGTHVAGTVVDCTPGLNIKILPIKVLGPAWSYDTQYKRWILDGQGTSSNVADGIDYAVKMGADVINLSLGGKHSARKDEAIENAIKAGVTVVVAAGNSDTNTSSYCPAHLNNAIVVSAIDSSLKRSIWKYGASNYGNSVDIAAPGTGILSCVPNNIYDPDGNNYYTGDFDSWNGTSMATPHIAAAAAMVRYQNHNYTPAQVESTLTSICMDLGSPGRDIYYGYGVPKLSKLIKEGVSPWIKLSSSSVTLAKGEKATLSASVNPGDVDIKWTTSDSSVATVSNGLVTANNSGTATITAFFTYNGSNYSATCNVIVPSITLSETSKSVYQTDKFSLTATTYPSGQTIKWSTSDSSIATVSNGTVSAIVPGTATITASFVYGGKTFSASCTVNVKKVSLELNPHNMTLVIGDVSAFTATTSPPNLTVSWESNNNMIASVSNGKITAKAPGNIIIKATMTYNGKTYSDSCAVKVVEPSVKISPSQVKISKNQAYQLNATTLPEGQTVTWRSEDTSICTVDSKGKITGKAIGNTMVYATITYGGKTYPSSCNVIVGEPKVSLNKTTMSMYVSDTQSLIASVIAVDGVNISSETKSDIVWKTSDSSVATVDSNGSVNGISVGTATITAEYTFCDVVYPATCKVTVVDKPGISLNKSSLSMYIGDTSTLTAKVTPANSTVTWKSSNTGVAMVSNGKITAISNSTATITASFRYNGVEYSTTCSVTVIKPTITLSSSSGSIYQGDSITISATTKPGGYTVSWTTSNSSVASVSSGKITGKSAGTATITAKFTYAGNTYSTSYSITVRAISLSLSSYSGSARSDDYYSLSSTESGYYVSLPTANHSPSGGSITWKVVSGSGYVSGSSLYILQPGSCTVRCTYTYNGYSVSKDYTFTWSAYKTTTKGNYFRSGPGTGYSQIGVIPAGVSVDFTELYQNGNSSSGDLWGKTYYDGMTGWIIISQW